MQPQQCAGHKPGQMQSDAIIKGGYAMDNENAEFYNVNLYRYTATRKDGTVEHGEIYGVSFADVGERLIKSGYYNIDVYTVVEL